MDNKVRRGSIVGPVILIGLGIIFLLNNQGILPWSVWEVILRLWPVLLIALGLDLLLGRRSIWGSLLALILTLAVLAAALWLSGARTEPGKILQTEDIKELLNGAKQAKIILAPAIGTLRIRAAAQSATLALGEIHHGRNEEVRRNFSLDDKTATFILRSRAGLGPIIGGWGDEGWDIQLAPHVPLDLETRLGVGDSELDLAGMKVNNLEVRMGVGRTLVALPSQGRFQARIHGGVGETVVVIPSRLESHIQVKTGLGSSHLAPVFERKGNDYYSPGYDRAKDRVDLEVNQALGNISIRRSGE